MPRPTQIGGGIQYHHQHNLEGASHNAINMVQWLRGVAEITGDPEHRALLAEALALSHKIGDAHRAAGARLAAFYEANPARFYRCRKGLEPWPDEIAEGFEPICTCGNRCPFHQTHIPGATEAECTCSMACPRHVITREPGDRPPLPALPHY
jgi:hypothetical protein